MSDWVRFHWEITTGTKKGIPRAERFVYMELSREARKNGGFILLPVDMSDLDAVCEVLGGDREEAVAAVRRWTKGPNPSIVFEGPKHRRICRVVNWKKWNPQGEPAGSSTPRVHKFRDGQGPVKPRNHMPPVAPAKLRNHTTPKTSAGGSEVIPGTVSPETVKPRTGKFDENMEPAAKPRDSGIINRNGSETNVSSSRNGSQIERQSQIEREIQRERADPDPEDVVYYPTRNRNTETPRDPDPGPLVGGGDQNSVVRIYDHYLVGWKARNQQGGRPPGLTPFRRKLIEARLDDGLDPDELMRACDGIWRSDWHVERGFTLLENVMRSREHVERFIGTPNSSRVQSSDGYTEDDAKEAQSRFLAEAEEKIAARAAAGYKDPLA